MRGISLNILSLCLLAGCSSSSQKPESSQTRPSGSPSSNSNVETSINANSFFAADAVDANVIQPGSTADRRRRRRERPRHTPIPGAGVSPLQFRDAAEDSTVAASMDATGNIIEYRVFRSHPKLSRVEARWIGNGEIVFKIELRGGKVVVKQTNQIKNLQTASTSDLVALAGI